MPNYPTSNANPRNSSKWKNLLNSLRFDTTNFTDLPDQEYKKQTIKNWTSSPCGSNYTAEEYLTREYFEEVEGFRYNSHPWLKNAIESFDIKGKSVLEIGFGMGTDHLTMARKGANMYGVDMTPKHLKITQNRLKLYNLNSNLILGDGETVPLEDNSMDFIYSFGVIHHSPNTEKIISEINRILKPKGKCFITVYHKNSLFFWLNVFLVNYIIKGGWQKRNLHQQISLVEYPNDNENLVLRLYKKTQFKSLFKNFININCKIKHLLPAEIPILGRFYKNQFEPTPFLSTLGNFFGWYIIIEATK